MPAVVNDPAAWAKLVGAARSGKEGFFAFYSSVADAITTNVSLMTLPVDDHAIVRGHAVFDTCSLAEGRMYRLQVHLDRLFASAASARLPLPFGGDEAANRERITEIVRATCVASGRRSCDVRFWLTAGTGNLGVTPAGCTPSLYVLCFGGLPPLPGSEDADTVGISEATVPLKPAALAELKSNNYLLNALCMLAAKERGGTYGIGAATIAGVLEFGVFLLAGDTHGYPVVRLDGEQIGDGRPGPVYAALKRLLLEDAATGNAHHEPLQAGGA
ncbi:hypothetical protein EMIHUDRAFT_110960 [Emiliania huxleyi CCMP1516]|uniref:Aminodeoxychorismate lyase n=2 Tax=Emiliania huxleyi TaxID=2903 RepID=A0A0D3KH88_EMIH1|nr:hypothetical protein EMIHUDRAFT_110960 [Emiliania huxleyi CCMP1516]EOD35123.1 hypothetical protein EMIHUDRAFT_110960 [Emiliania huxleyi CCMP1516]|eukprot:XP_005787552.1 hypothetical protein EMIHUDRAFT_110960 [Emiliania huxleyi CCMP1516]